MKSNSCGRCGKCGGENHAEVVRTPKEKKETDHW